MMKLTYELESAYTEKGYAVVAGCDEAGRGPLCGPVFAAAAILPIGLDLPGMNDSKKLSEKKREQLFDLIKENALSFGIASATPAEIDELNILNASQLAMRRAVAQLSPQPGLVLIDGNVSRGFPMDTVTVVKGDGISPSIAAASILAKVSRDRLLLELDKQYPEYGLAKHKGYPTKEHMDAVRKYGPNEIYRRSFLKFLDSE